ncbi:hypothetical protein WI460_05655 [Gemmatimonadota bacterium Y43]|uniref:hypothetical protein n=1 Tax=Gaopeijia maritima TaxID=3119007 RepID=UPI003270F5FA
MSDLPKTCIPCRQRPCESESAIGMDLCPYGIVYRRDPDGRIVRAEPTVPVRHLAGNLRHEINPLLAFIMNEANRLDPTATTRAIDAGDPVGRILGATLILDDTIQMISGVHEMHLLVEPRSARDSIVLQRIVRNRFEIYSLLEGAGRSKRLVLEERSRNEMSLSFGVPIIEYVIAVLLDNVWKFSLADTPVTVVVSNRGGGLAQLRIQNVGQPIPESLDPFGLGNKADATSRGFGYGLYWARLLVDRYNAALDDDGPPLALEREEIIQRSVRAIHSFSLENIRVDTGR